MSSTETEHPATGLRPALLLLGVLLAGCGTAPAEPAAEPEPAPVAEAVGLADVAALAEERITADRMFEHIDFLARDEMRGRDTPSPELEEAADYLADHFERLGLTAAGDDGTFIQRWPFERMVLDEDRSAAWAEMAGERHEWRYGWDYFAIPAPPAAVEGTPVYAPDPGTVMEGLPGEAQGSPLVVELPEGLGPDFALAIQGGMQAGVSSVVLLMDEESDAGMVHQLVAALEAGAAGQMPFPIIGLSYEAGRDFLAAAEAAPQGGRDPPGRDEARVLEEVTVFVETHFEDRVDEVPNVVAELPGSDPDRAREAVVLTAHFDHVGVGPPDEEGDSIYSGADDNASGTAAIMEVAATFAELPEAPERTVVFLAVSGEERGLLGSAYYAENPTHSAGEMVANLNLDMVSRNDPDTVYAIGKEFSTIGDLAVEMGERHPELNLVVAPDPEPEEQAFLRSDHFSFVEQGVPALMLTTWLHDDYHVPSDTPDRVDPDKAARVARLASLLLYRLASDEDAPTWTDAGEDLLEELGMGAGR